MSDSLYQAHILDHYKRPRNCGAAAPGAQCASCTNASCGDALSFCIECKDGAIASATFEGTGCAISQALASMLTEHVRGMDVAQARALTDADVYALLGAPISTGRERCATLALRALQDALTAYEA